MSSYIWGNPTPPALLSRKIHGLESNSSHYRWYLNYGQNPIIGHQHFNRTWLIISAMLLSQVRYIYAYAVARISLICHLFCYESMSPSIKYVFTSIKTLLKSDRNICLNIALATTLTLKLVYYHLYHNFFYQGQLLTVERQFFDDQYWLSMVA